MCPSDECRPTEELGRWACTRAVCSRSFLVLSSFLARHAAFRHAVWPTLLLGIRRGLPPTLRQLDAPRSVRPVSRDTLRAVCAQIGHFLAKISEKHRTLRVCSPTDAQDSTTESNATPNYTSRKPGAQSRLGLKTAALLSWLGPPRWGL